MGNSFCTNKDIAIIGMAGRFPGATNVDELWNNIVDTTESIIKFSDTELLESGVPLTLLEHPQYVKAKGYLKDASLFDAKFFDFTKQDAEVLDPQFRILLEIAWEALENAAYVSENSSTKIGVFAGSSTFNSYYLNNLYNNHLSRSLAQDLAILTYNAKDFLASLLAYKLNLTGPCLSIQTACSTSLVAICVACENLLNYQCDIALAGGISITMPLKSGYLYQAGMILSQDGHCRTFDNNANGSVIGNGGGILVLKRLDEAVADRDFIHAIIKGFSVNNDGQNKIGFSAPSIEGQKKVIEAAHKSAKVIPEMISYIETHGTATLLGDMVELAALNEVFGAATKRISDKSIAIGALKPNIGHLDVAAGIAGVIKTIQALKHATLPPNINFDPITSGEKFSNTPFYINTSGVYWPSVNYPRMAGVSSFGMGGTNSHIILQEKITVPSSEKNEESLILLVLSAKTRSALIRLRRNLSQYLQEHPTVNIESVAFTLQVGRKNFDCRFACIGYTLDQLIRRLNCLDYQEILNLDSEAFVKIDGNKYHVLYNMAKDWLANKSVDWDILYKDKHLHRIPLPTYPFERREYWATPVTSNISENLLSTNIKVHTYSKQFLTTSSFDTIESSIKDIFKSFLGMDTINSADDFYDFGGDSLLSLQVLDEINKKLNIPIDVQDLIQNPSPARLTQLIRSKFDRGNS